MKALCELGLTSCGILPSVGIMPVRLTIPVKARGLLGYFWSLISLVYL